MTLAERQAQRSARKEHDYRHWSEAELDAAIMYQVQYGSDLQRLDHLLAARNYREA